LDNQSLLQILSNNNQDTNPIGGIINKNFNEVKKLTTKEYTMKLFK